MANPRETALLALYKIEYEGAYSNMAVKDALSLANGRDKGLITQLVYGGIRRKLTLDYVISKYSKIGKGNLLMPYSVVNAFATIGDHCIINTSAVVEHDCTVGSFCHVSVKSVMTGACSIGDGVFLGAGSTMRDGRSVGEWTTVGCGSAVVKNLEPNAVYVGCPAKLLRKNNK